LKYLLFTQEDDNLHRKGIFASFTYQCKLKQKSKRKWWTRSRGANTHW